MRISIVGAGLLGTSLGLALAQQGHEIAISDQDSAREALARDLIGADGGGAESELLFVAVPTPALAEVISASIRQNLAQTVSDLGSVKSRPLLEVQRSLGGEPDLGRYVGGHPMAGRERSGPQGARADLFAGRPWILTPNSATSASALASVRGIVEQLGAVPVEMSPDEHDRAVGAISHLPQLVASVVADLIGQQPEHALSLAGQGVKDLTRIAGSDPELWSGILQANAEVVAPLWRALTERMVSVTESLERFDAKSIYQVIADGQRGRNRLPGKHGGLSTNFTIIPVVVDDRPGQLGALFAAAAACGVNIEDIAMEHSPGQETGLVELAIRPDDADGFVDFLRAEGWRVHPQRRQSDPIVES